MPALAEGWSAGPVGSTTWRGVARLLSSTMRCNSSRRDSVDGRGTSYCRTLDVRKDYLCSPLIPIRELIPLARWRTAFSSMD